MTKDGTNQFHGSAFEFYRTRNFTAVSHNSTTKGPYARNEYGATLGGPIRKDKDFFFGSFGGLRATTSPAFFRTFGIFETLKFQLRGKVANVFNLTNLGAPTAAMNSSNFGEITGSGGSNRITQVGGGIFSNCTSTIPACLKSGCAGIFFAKDVPVLPFVSSKQRSSSPLRYS